MPRQTIHYHPDSSDTETQSFIYIGIAILFGLTAVLLTFLMLDEGPLEPTEIIIVSFFAIVPIVLGILAFKGNKESMAYDRASQIVNYSKPVDGTLKSIEEKTISTTNSEGKKINELRYLVSLSINSTEYLLTVKQKTAAHELTEKEIKAAVSAYVDPVSEEVVAFKLKNSLFWGIPYVVLQKHSQSK